MSRWSAVRRLVWLVIGVATAACGVAVVHVPDVRGDSFTLSVSVQGPGEVVSAPAGIKCPGTCSASFNQGTTVGLTATAKQGYTFTRWEGDCSGAQGCKVSMTGDRKVQATFVYADRTNWAAMGRFGEVFADGGPGGTLPVKLTALMDNQPPKPVLQVPPEILAGHTVVLDARGSRDPDGTVGGYRWDLNGDGTYDDAFGPVVDCAFARPGQAQISVEVIDNKGRISPLTRLVTVRPGRSYDPARGLARMNSHALMGSFDQGFSGFHQLGDAFSDRHTRSVSLSQILDTNGRLGGNYADGIMVPVGSVGTGWMSSFRPDAELKGLSSDARGNLAVGALVSSPFVIKDPYINYRMGGDGMHAGGGERVELLIRRGKAFAAMKSMTRTLANDQETMAPVSLPTRPLHGDEAAIAIVDNSTTGHINIDDVGQGAVATVGPAVERAALPYYELSPRLRREDPSPPPPVYGIADFHSHPAAAQGFGALHGVRTYMGVPGGDVANYDRYPREFAHDVYADDDYHFGGPLGAFIVNVLEGRRQASDQGAALASIGSWPSHPPQGGRCLGGGCGESHSTSIGPSHEQMNIWEIHRAWEGGLRLVSSLAINSSTIDFGMGTPVPGTTEGAGAPTADNRVTVASDRNVVMAQVETMRELANLNFPWMKIAYDPQQAYDIMSQGKLAVILGTELDTNGSLGFPTPRQEVDWLWHLGIRQVTPIHCCDNKIGGAALFQDLYNTANDFLHRPQQDLTAPQIGTDIAEQGLAINPSPGAPPHPGVGYFFQVAGGCPDPSDRGNCILWRFDSPGGDGSAALPSGPQNLASIDSNCIAVFGSCIVHPGLYPVGVGAYDHISRGMRNVHGLTQYGRQYIEALMSRGMLIDMEHMSDATVAGLIDPGTAPGHVKGPVWGKAASCSVDATYNEPRATCWSGAYPLMSSHTSYRPQSLRPLQTTFKGFLPREFERTPDQIEYIHRSGGVVGPIVTQDAINTIDQHVSHSDGPTWQIVDGHDRPITSAPANDCAGSSKSWAQAYLYSVQKMGGQGVGLATDMLFFGGPRPRFGFGTPSNGRPYSCGDSSEAPDPAAEEHKDPSQYDRAAQGTEIPYVGPGTPLYGSGGTMRRSQDPAGVVKNFNTEGMLTYGTLPDLIQDAHNDGVSYSDLLPLNESAQAYVNMWAKAYALAGCFAGSTVGYSHCSDDETPMPLDAAAVCKNSCPDSEGRGLALTPVGGPFHFRNAVG